ncbi:hypothetical protein [Anaeromusa acidaminophila]|uniref:hypothetical protein n=1 Tax=Anaeromusa acidaminophila TaxID=81464 RepID=UPI00035EA36B|nr:hypothetical protein [Anaeromusa acidaminophila]
MNWYYSISFLISNEHDIKIMRMNKTEEEAKLSIVKDPVDSRKSIFPKGAYYCQVYAEDSFEVAIVDANENIVAVVKPTFSDIKSWYGTVSEAVELGKLYGTDTAYIFKVTDYLFETSIWPEKAGRLLIGKNEYINEQWVFFLYDKSKPVEDPSAWIRFK